ncbi:hypothetical protein E3P89_01856 [Wallemia ichthyophaga]|uniref:Uncharacterized protein n=1 Tax=Wallemia ichthyophaga TaxID=245174 RepID=A0A4T0GLF6_WALIC|nr:hypothetical protein E3P95_00933 [Wallemia ichthyophaga]TIB03251.1 hypothetical protein E3P94_01065 [Wallemia ichthyophaga]TIB15412.1 hypothetical protein E3P90_00855 [Wallemia ichthyophaga]TIB17254.1 hypothetical protein E3P93_00712 [Wallemia ichthyophaga]TIB22892.1 hypothetical protein E3P89_01856 [Wallemia ichthyophaga]
MLTLKFLYKRLLAHTKRRRRKSAPELPQSESFKCIGILDEESMFDMFDQMYNTPILTHRPNLTYYEMWYRNLKHYDHIAASVNLSSTSSSTSNVFKFTPHNSPVIKHHKNIDRGSGGSFISSIFDNLSMLDSPSSAPTRPSMREVVVDGEIVTIEFSLRI